MSESKVIVVDNGDALIFTWHSLYAYCGPTQIIASALMFRLFERAFRDLSPSAFPDRESLSFLSGFPGVGIKECVELVTRILTRHPERFIVDSNKGPEEAPPTKEGSLYFEVQIGEQRGGYWPSRSLFNEKFKDNVERYQAGGGSREEQESYLRYKRELASEVLTTPMESLFTFRSVVPR